MVASYSGTGVETDTLSSSTSSEDCHHGNTPPHHHHNHPHHHHVTTSSTSASAMFITDLIHQGADVGMATERSGETSLHLAARYARADAARRLLEAGECGGCLIGF